MFYRADTYVVPLLSCLDNCIIYYYMVWLFRVSLYLGLIVQRIDRKIEKKNETQNRDTTTL